jgi:hypothetical protein
MLSKIQPDDVSFPLSSQPPIPNPTVDLETHTVSNGDRIMDTGVVALQPNEARSSPHDTTISFQAPDRPSEQRQSVWNPYKNRFRLLAACSTSFVGGMSDSAPGALIASIEKYDDQLIDTCDTTNYYIETTISTMVPSLLFLYVMHLASSRLHSLSALCLKKPEVRKS